MTDKYINLAVLNIRVKLMNLFYFILLKTVQPACAQFDWLHWHF